MKSPLLSGRHSACALLFGLCACASAPEPPPQAAEEPQVEILEIERPGATATEAAASAPAKVEIETLVFRIEIPAPVEKVWDTMLSPEGYQEWTKPFMAGSYFEGSWSEGERMHFLAPGASGMVAVIAENRPHELVSIEHIGFVVNGVEDTTSDSVRSWAPAYEIYRFAAIPGGTEVTIEHEVIASFEGYMSAVWPKALAALESLCEAD